MRTLFIIASWHIILLLHFYNRTYRFVKYLLNKLFCFLNEFPQQVQGVLQAIRILYN